MDLTKKAPAAFKPRFIPKKERLRMEAEEKAREEEAEKKRKEEARQRAAAPTGPRAMRQAENTSPANSETRRNRTATANGGKSGQKTFEEIQAEMIRTKYMGPDVNQSTFSANKKRKRRTGNKFNFDWDPDEDTTTPWDPIYQNQPNNYNLGEDEKDEWVRRKARMIEQSDPEHGKERARDLLESHERAKARLDRYGLGKHWSEKSLGEMQERDWRIFKEDYGISTKGGRIPNPMRKWRESDLPSRLLDIVERVGYEDPTPIQRAAIPIALQGRDIIGVAVTGSGKTAAFLLPLLVYIQELPPIDEITKNDGPYGLILAPTRELAQQIESEARKFATPFGYNVVSIVGGHALEEQSYALRNGAEIVVATPGRLVDCLERHLLVLSQCCYIIMDEADRMIDLGFEESLNKILSALPVSNEKPDSGDAEDSGAMTKFLGGVLRYRQTMMYTATMPPSVELIAKKYLRRPAVVTIGNVGEAVDTVEQRVEFIRGEDKRKQRLQEILGSGEFPWPVIVFVNIKRNCDAIAKDIKSMGFSAVTLHGGKTQEQREQALAAIRQGKAGILVATDLAGRGIDVADVSLVVNFNMATSIESYTHRIGRTGRAGKSGVAITFLGNEDNDVLYDLKQMIAKSTVSKVPEELRRHEAAQSKPNRGGVSKKDNIWQ